ncbi:MAG: integration host factor subunit alpha [Halobacteriovoraceae bacterium]|nr:integration host factor subunit alpha [Halobacteriovoraceae bacterium]
MATLTKASIAEKIQQKAGFSKKDSADLIDLIFGVIKKTLINGEIVKISGFGNFTIKEKKKRNGRNPQTGETMDISARKVLTFKSSLVLKEDITARYIHRLNENGEENKSLPAREGDGRALKSFTGSYDE